LSLHDDTLSSGQSVAGVATEESRDEMLDAKSNPKSQTTTSSEKAQAGGEEILGSTKQLPIGSAVESEERFRLLIDNIKDYAIFLMDPEGVILTWNAGAESVNGYKGIDVIGRNFTMFYTKEDIERRHPQHELEIARETGRYEEEGWRLRKDGSLFWANIVITRLDDPSGRLKGFAKITRDLTEKRKAEEALRESEERSRLFVQSVKDYAMIMLDPSGIVVSWNEGARGLKGYEASEIVGQHFSKFYEPEEVAVGKCEYELVEAKATGRFEDEGWRVRKDGTKFWANVVLTALRDHKGILRGFAKVTRDMTERKRAEDKLRMAHQTLEKRVEDRTLQLQRAVESRDEFLSIASHELRTPLTALKLQNQLLERHLKRLAAGEGLPAENAKEVAELTKRQVNQLTHLVDDMLDVSRIATGRLQLEFSETDISGLVNDVKMSFLQQFQNVGIIVTTNIEPSLKAHCDPHRIEQVISNLISNAIKYGRGAPIEIVAQERDSKIEIQISDRGPGIEPKDQQRIFERFERAVPASEISGLGLGLFISRQITNAHGGQLRVRSQLGEGATFTVELPVLR
jgi:PAS domain S-box-containing protein